MPELSDEDVAPGKRRGPTFRECRRAAHSIRTAERGAEAVDTVRPRGVHWLLRSRGPLPILLFVAASDGRLVWRGPDSLALLQPPADRHLPGAGHPVLRRVNRHWDLLLFAGPPLLALAPLPLLVAVRDVVGRDVLLIGGLLLILVALLYIAALMCVGMLHLGISLIRALRPPGGPDRVGAEVLPGHHWSMTLCHQPDPRGADDLLHAVEQHLNRLIVATAAQAVTRVGADAGRLTNTGPLVCVRAGITTDAMRDRVTDWAEDLGGAAAVVLRFTGKSRARRRPAVLDDGRFAVLYLFAVAVVVLVEATFVPGWEREECAATGCAGRPVTYPAALRWLAQRLLLTDPPGLSAGSWYAVAIGWLTSLMSIVGVGVFVVAVVQLRASRKEAVRDIQEILDDVDRRSTVLLLVATQRERLAMLAAAQAVIGTAATRRYLPHHTVFRLGQIAGADVLLVQGGPGAVGPTAATTTVAHLIPELYPDFLVVTGICFGLRPDEQRLGDIVVSRQLRAIDHRKVTEPAGGGPATTLIRGDLVTASPTALDRFGTADPPPGVRVHVGTMLSASVLVDSRGLCDELLRLDPEAVGGEMEGAGAYAAAAPAKLDWIVVKAISDWGYDKTDDAQELAAGNVARFVIDTIRTGALNEPVPGARLKRN